MFREHLDIAFFYNNTIYYCFRNSNTLHIEELNGTESTIEVPNKFNIVNFQLNKACGKTIILADQNGDGNNKLWLVTGDVSPIFIGPNTDESCLQAAITDDGTRIFMNIITSNKRMAYIREINLETYEETNLFQSDNLFSFYLDNNEIIVNEVKDTNNIYVHKIYNEKIFSIPKENFHTYCFNNGTKYFYLSDEFTDYYSLISYDKKKEICLELDQASVVNIIRTSSSNYIVQAQKNGWDQLYLYDKSFTRIKTFNIKGSIKTLDYDEARNSLLALVSSPNEPEYFVLTNLNNGETVEINKKGSLSMFSFTDVLLERGDEKTSLPASIFLSKNTNGKFIILLNGGPYATKSVAYSQYIIYLLEKGFSLFIPYIYGTNGFGKKYKNKINGQWGNFELKDIEESYNYIKGKFTNRIGIMGVSYGGFLTLLAATHTSCNFDFCVSFNGPTSLSSFIRNLGYINRNLVDFISENGGLKSPERQINNINSPILIIQSEKDSKVNLVETKYFVGKCKEQNKRVDYIVMNGTGHYNYNFINTFQFQEALDLINNY